MGKNTHYWFGTCVQCPRQTIFKGVFWYVGNMFFQQSFNHFNILSICGTFWWLSKVIVFYPLNSVCIIDYLLCVTSMNIDLFLFAYLLWVSQNILSYWHSSERKLYIIEKYFSLYGENLLSSITDRIIVLSFFSHRMVSAKMSCKIIMSFLINQIITNGQWLYNFCS